jgi:hypothetical protein
MVKDLTEVRKSGIFISATGKGAWRRWLSRRPVKPEIAGSRPVAPVLLKTADHQVGSFFIPLKMAG